MCTFKNLEEILKPGKNLKKAGGNPGYGNIKSLLKISKLGFNRC